MKFKYRDPVRVTSGFYEGCGGKVASPAGRHKDTGNLEQHYWVVLDDPLPEFPSSCDCPESILTHL